jgi:hypothetical protein
MQFKLKSPEVQFSLEKSIIKIMKCPVGLFTENIPLFSPVENKLEVQGRDKRSLYGISCLEQEGSTTGSTQRAGAVSLS